MWPKIISKHLIGVRKISFINAHLGLILNNRENFINFFWVIIEQCLVMVDNITLVPIVYCGVLP